MYSYPAGLISYTIQSGDSLWSIAQRFHTTVQAIALENPGLIPGNLRIGQIIRIPAEYSQPSHSLASPLDGNAQTLSNHLRLLWEQHVYWTRMAILGIVFGLPDADRSAARLLRNPKDFEAALRPFYGGEIAAKFAELLTSHLTIAAELVSAAKAGDAVSAADAENRWYLNADQIAEFLSSINPYWPSSEWRRMLHDHLAMTKDEATALLTQRYEFSIGVFEAIEQEALLMADRMTQGMIRQFSPHF